MDKTKRFYVNEPGAKEPIIFDQIFAEKVGGGLVKNSAFDLYPGMAISADGYPIKGYRVVEDAASDATSIKIAKNSGIASGDVLGKGNVTVACTAVDKSNADHDVVTISLGVAVSKGDVLFQGSAASRAAGYDDCESTDDGALKVVASGATAGQINLADATPYYGSKTLAADDYVKAVPAIVAAPKYTPAYLLGTFVEANSGDELVKLVNGANIRKETAPVADEVVALMKNITKI